MVGEVLLSAVFRSAQAARLLRPDMFLPVTTRMFFPALVLHYHGGLSPIVVHGYRHHDIPELQKKDAVGGVLTVLFVRASPARKDLLKMKGSEKPGAQKMQCMMK